MNPDISYEVTLGHDTAGKISNAVTQKSTNCELRLRSEGACNCMSSSSPRILLVFAPSSSSKNPIRLRSGSCPKVDLSDTSTNTNRESNKASCHHKVNHHHLSTTLV